MNTTPNSSPVPMNAATDAAALTRLRALTSAEAETLLDQVAALQTTAERQDYLISAHRIGLSLPALEAWFHEAQTARTERTFAAYLADVRRAAERAEAFRELLSHAEHLHQVNVVLLATRLFDALVARDQAAIEQLARSFAEVVNSLGLSSVPLTH